MSLLYLPLSVLGALEQSHGVGAAGMVSSFGIAYALGFLLFGHLSDRLGRRTVMVFGLTALAVITALLSLAQTPQLLVTGRILQGFSAASFPPVAIAYLAEQGTPKQRVWSVAWMSTAFLSAGLLGQIYGGAVTTRWGLGAAFLPLCGIYALTGWQLWRMPPDKVGSQALQRSAHNYRTVSRLLADVNADLKLTHFPADRRSKS
ncbi:MFS transporter, partial [Diaphorobacter sp.]|uniref:MFS transporter n=1 Tax=Diaphorobacter sp. TaxID=1934310 RepID=UPI003917EE60